MRISARQLALLPILLLQGLMGIPASAEDKPAFPVEITHAFGTTVISEKPVRVATVAWANHEVPLALGIVPVGMAAANFGDDDGDGVLPWVAERLKELGLVDNLIPEPLGGAHRKPEDMAARIKAQLLVELDALEKLPADALLERRYERLMAFGLK